MKVFGAWSVDLATRWNSDFLLELKETVEQVLSGLQVFVRYDHIEVQERVRLSTAFSVRTQCFLHTIRPRIPLNSLDLFRQTYGRSDRKLNQS